MARDTTNKYAVVTGSNKGIGLETVRQLASNGITVVLTARDENKGLDAVEKLKASGLSHHLVLFHKLDVTDPQSILSLAQFIKTQFGKLDILVNNAGITGVKPNVDALQASGYHVTKGDDAIDWNKFFTQDYELSVKCLETNYYGTEQTCEALLPLLQLSDSPRIANLSSYVSALKDFPEKARKVARRCRKPYRRENRNAYKVSKAAINAYTRVLAKRDPEMCVNCVCPGFVKTDINFNSGTLTVEEGAESPVRLALLPDGGPTGRFFSCKEEAPF
ncbi:(+)-neomenthol dehydrogenase [Melia azedarach]|uniref:(+)-neomenthol dehydrogenase n=1 Tax=Melia azedarach TaxID=155640 RepID=A0ACC1Y7K6_MELAZ|nr:(+)-neomenthol dehydrogenase [Melia azedarach]